MGDLNIRLEARMSQSLVMTPRLVQAIKLLQYNHLDLVQHVNEAMLENPTLEVVPDSDSAAPEASQALVQKAADSQNDLLEQRNGNEGNIDWERFLEQMNDTGPRQNGATGGTIHDDLPPIETNLTYGESLTEHLMFQLQMARCGEDERAGAEAIIRNLDDRGYLAVPLEELSVDAEVDPEVMEEAIELVQSFDPVGCGARDLVECLVVQARLQYPQDDTFERILKDHLSNLERRNYAAISRDLGIDVEDVIEYHKMIQHLDPLPGRGFGAEDPRYITPDIFVDKRNGEWVITLNEDGMPELRVSRYYQKVLRGASKSDRDYLLQKLRGAEFLINSINMRRRTIRKVMESIVKHQREFFEGGAEHLRPLVLQAVADDVGRHMSTVSRVTTNKYVHTPHGTFELKYFFSAAVKQQTGGDMAAEAIKSRIRQMVDDEEGKNPLSDQQIADALKRDGITVARRTVAKYREGMGILSSSKRKQMF